jgi:hypothetical protein
MVTSPTGLLVNVPGLLNGQSLLLNPAVDPRLIVPQFVPGLFAANSLTTPFQIAAAGGGSPFIASYLGISPFPNQFLNANFNPFFANGLGAPTGGIGGVGGGLGLNGLAGLGTQGLGGVQGLQGFGLTGLGLSGLGGLGLGGLNGNLGGLSGLGILG